DAQCDRSSLHGVTHFVEGWRPESARFGAVAPPISQKFSFRREFLNAIDADIGGIHIPGAVEGHKLRAGKAAARGLGAAKLARFASVLAPLADEFSVGGKLLDAAVPLIGDVQESIWAEGNRSGKLELPVRRALLPPLPQQFARRRV